MSNRRVIGIDLGGTKLIGGVVSEDLIVHHRAHRSSRGADQNEIVERLVEVVDELRAGADDEPPVEAVGFGVPCVIDHESGRAVTAVNLPIVDLPFRDLMSERLGLPVVVDNDANVAALAEQRFGAAKGKKHVVLLTLGTGVGGGVIIDGQVFRGATGAGAELGHMSIDLDGPPCQGNCPNYGCLETMVSGTAIAREATLAAHENPESGLGRALAAGTEIQAPLVSDLAQGGDQVALEVLRQIGFNLGVGIVNYIHIFNPEAIVIGGGVAAAGEMILGPARKVVATRTLMPGREQCEIVPAYFGGEAGMVGAAALAITDALPLVSA